MTHEQLIAAMYFEKPGDEARTQVLSILHSLLDFKRTPEWSVSMLEDIDALSHTDLPDFEPGSIQAWRPH